MLVLEQLAELTEQLDKTAADYAQRGLWDDAIHLLKMGLQVVQGITAAPEYGARLQARLASLLWKRGEMGTAFALLKKAQATAAQAHDLPTLALALFNLGEIHALKCFHMLVGNAYQALDYHQQALLVYGQLQDLPALITSLGRLGQIHEQLGRQETAGRYYAQAIALSMACGYPLGQARPLGRLSAFHLRQNQPLAAQTYAQRALITHVEAEDWEGASAALLLLATATYALSHCLPLALPYAQQALALAEQLDDKLGTAQALYQLGDLYAQAGQPTAAADYLQAAAEIAEAHYLQGITRPALAYLAAVHSTPCILN